MYGWRGWGGNWQVGVQAGVFSIFDLESDSQDLINADYPAGVPLSFGRGPFSARLRLAHQSSHLGDEFRLRSRTNRVNLSYEFVDLIASVRPIDGVRLYGGGGALVRTDPDDLDRAFIRIGLELTSPHPLAGELPWPVAAVDVPLEEQTDWQANVSVRAGVEVRSDLLTGRRLQVLASYCNGRSPNGQFYERDIEFWGAGLYF